MNERAIFMEALTKDTPAERAAYLAEACGNDAALRQRIAALLQSHEEAGSFLNKPVAERLAEKAANPVETRGASYAGADDSSWSCDEPLVCRPGTVIGPYKLLQQIGEGGMGIVWMAEQTQPVRRKVALKLIKNGTDSRQVIARFEAERQALALMDHPNIARVLDAGTTEGGRPYFVMELVKGMPITQYCDERRLGLPERLKLFAAVCGAVQHAHQKGIIHRDLKPSNVMVCAYDGLPVPKVIDFGVAKAAGPRLTDKTLFTELGQVVGTLEYMSPEQAELNQLDVDTRSDIYTLGVILYELLTGTTPLERKRVQSATLLEVLRLIREEEPPRPSTRLSSTDELPAIAANPGLEPKKLSGLLRGEVDWIVMKAIEKERNRRYETASAFARDIERYLNDEPVQACPPSTWYRLGKSVRRHRLALGSAATVVLTLLLTGASVGWSLWDRSQREDLERGEQIRRVAETQREVSVALGRAESLAGQARQMPGAGSAEAGAALVVWRQAEDAVAQASAALRAGTADDDMRQRVAAAQSQLELEIRQADLRLDQARRREKLFRDLDDARMSRLAVVDQKMDRAGAAARFAAAFLAYGLDVDAGPIDKLVGRITAEEPEVHEALVVALIEWANDAAVSETRWSPQKLRAIVAAADRDDWRKRYRVASAGSDAKVLGSLIQEALDKPLTAPNTILLARDLDRRGLGAESMTLLRRGRTHHPTDFWMHFTLGSWLCTDQGRSPEERKEGIGCFRTALALRPRASIVHNNLGAALLEAGQLDEALLEFKTTLTLEPGFAMTHINIAYVHHARKQLKEAFAEYTTAADLDPKDARSHHGLGRVWHAWKDLVKAKGAYRKAILLKADYAAPHFGLGNALAEEKNFEEAIVEFETAIKLDHNHPEASRDLAKLHVNLGNAHWRSKNLPQATIAYRNAMKIDANLASAHFGLGNVLLDQKNLDGAMAEFQTVIKLAPTHAKAHNALGNVFRDKKRLTEAIDAYKKSIDLDPKDAQPHNGLGMVFYDRKQWKEAKSGFETAIKLDPGFSRAYNNLATCWHDRAQWKEAQAAYQKAIDIDPNDAMPRHGLGNVLRLTNDLQGAMEQYRKAIAIDPSYPHPHDGLGDVYLAKKMYEKAKEEYEKAIQLEPRFALPYIGVGIVHYFRKDYEKAIVKFKEASERDPADADPHLNIGLARQRMRQWREAETAFRKALEIRPSHFKAQNNLGLLLVETKRWDEAIVELRKASDLEPKDPGPHFNLANVLRHQGKFAPALQAMQKADALGRGKSGWTMPSSSRIKQYERLVELEKKESRELVSHESASKGIRGRLTKDDLLNCYPNALQSFRKSYPMKLKAGQAYQIDLTGDFDVFLHVEDNNYVTRAYNDDVTPPNDLDARLVFTPQKDGIYHVVVTSYKSGDTGNYTLTVNNVAKAGSEQTIAGELTKTDKAVQAKYYKIHQVDLVAGRPYVFELDSPAFDSYLVFLDPTGKQKLAYNDEAGEFTSASRIDFTPSEAGAYRLVVTTYHRGETGPYTLRIQGYDPAKARQEKQ